MAGPQGPVISRSQLRNPAMDWFLQALQDIFKDYGEPQAPPQAPPPDFTQLAGQLTPQDVGGALADPRNKPSDPLLDLGFGIQNTLNRVQDLPGKMLRNAPADVAENAQAFGQLALNPAMLSDLVAQGAVGGAAKTLNLTPAGEQALLPEGVRAAMAVPEGIGQYYQESYGSPEQALSSLEQRPFSSILDALDLADLTPTLPIVGMAAKRAAKTAGKAATQWAGLPGIYSRSYEAAGKLPERLKLNQVMNSLMRLDAPPEELAFIKFTEGLQDLQTQLPGGQNAVVTREQVQDLIKSRTPEFSRREEIKLSKPNIKLRRYLKEKGLQVPKEPSGWNDIAQLARRDLQTLSDNTTTWTAEANRAYDQINEYYQLAMDAARGPVARLADPGPPFNMTFEKPYSVAGVRDYQVSSWNLPPEPRNIAAQGYYAGRKLKRSSWDDPNSWTIYGPEGDEEGSIAFSEAATPDEALARYAQRYGMETEAFGPVHFKNPNIMHARTGLSRWIGPNDPPKGSDPALLDVGEPGLFMHEGQLDAFNVGRSEGFSSYPLVPSDMVRLILDDGGQAIPSEPMTAEKAQEMLAALQANGQTARVETLHLPEPTVKRRLVSKESDELFKEQQTRYNARDDERTPEWIVRGREIEKRQRELDEMLREEKEGGLPKVGSRRRPPFSQSTGEDLLFRLLVMDAAQRDLPYLATTAGRAQEDFYGHGTRMPILAYGEAVNPDEVLRTRREAEAQGVLEALKARGEDARLTFDPINDEHVVSVVKREVRGLSDSGQTHIRKPVEPPDLASLVGDRAAQALLDPLNAQMPGRTTLKRVEVDPQLLKAWEEDAIQYQGYRDPEDIRRYVEGRRQSLLAREQSNYSSGSQRQPGEQFLTLPTEDPFAYNIVREFEPPVFKQEVQARIEQGEVPEEARQAVASLYDPTAYRALRQQYEALGFTPEQARQLAENPNLVAQGGGLDLTPMDYGAWQQEAEGKLTRAEAALRKRKELPQRYAEMKQKLMSQGMSEEQATAKANRAFNAGPEGVQVGDLSKAQADLDELKRAYESDLAQMQWAQEEAAAVQPTVERLKRLPTRIEAKNMPLGHGEDEFVVGGSLEHGAWKLANNYNVRYRAKWQNLIDKYLPGAYIEEGFVRSRREGATRDFAQPSFRIVLPEDLRKKLLAPREQGGGLPLMALAPFLLAWESEALGESPER